MNKKTIMFFSSLMILIYHLWLRLTNTVLENYLLQICVIGVDLFFLVSAYSIAKSKITYKEFIKNRFVNIYLKFILFTIIYVIFSSKSFLYLIKTILGIELFIKGGGSFLWFIPAIMIVYLLLPLYKKIENKHKYVFIMVLITYILLTILISTFTNYNSIFIFTNRIPVILIGYYLGKSNLLNSINNKYIVSMIILLLLGNVLSYFTYVNHISINIFNDIMYLLNIPLTIGLLLLFNLIKDNRFTKALGSSTLELYAIQMILGFKLVTIIYKLIGIKLITNILIIVLLVSISIIINKILTLIINKCILKKI